MLVTPSFLYTNERGTAHKKTEIPLAVVTAVETDYSEIRQEVNKMLHLD